MSQPARVLFRIHDPTIPDRQGTDIGTRYRSAIFYASQTQRRIAEATIRELDGSGLLPAWIVTPVEPARTFWEAEAEHQAYFERQPEQRACNHIRPSTMPACDRALTVEPDSLAFSARTQVRLHAAGSVAARREVAVICARWKPIPKRDRR
jgi:hypothetical protein